MSRIVTFFSSLGTALSAEERKLLCPKPLRALRISRIRVVLRSGSTFHGETAIRLLRRMRKASLLCL